MTEQSAKRADGKTLEIPEGHQVLLQDHPRDHKIQDHYKHQMFMVVGQHLDSTVYYIKPVTRKGLSSLLTKSPSDGVSRG